MLEWDVPEVRTDIFLLENNLVLKVAIQVAMMDLVMVAMVKEKGGDGLKLMEEELIG